MAVSFEKFRAMFVDECGDHLRKLEDAIQRFHAGEPYPLLIDECFRAAHSIKGGAGMFGLDRLIPPAHAIESILAKIRSGELTPNKELCDCLASAVDCIFSLIEAEVQGTAVPFGFETPVISRLSSLAGLEVRDPARLDLQALDMGSEQGGCERRWRIEFRPHRGLLKRASEPLLLVRQLRGLGTLTVTADISGLPDFAELHPLETYLAWTFDLVTVRGLADIRSVFEFVEGDCDLEISDVTEPHGKVVSDPLQGVGNATEQRPAVATASASVSTSPTSASIRVDVEKIDRLVNLAGEIAISQALVSQLIDQQLVSGNPRLFQELSQLLVHVQTLQDSVMSIRAQQVRTVFDRMPRLVRELEAQLGKNIILRISGEQTEIDKTVIEQIADPIVHAIRNAADHGLEQAAVRLAAGKPAEGMIALHAEQRGSNIIITISDDGRGLDRAGIRRRAMERGLIVADAELSTDDIDNLIFLPGFSTAEQVSAISGRGVGMDVVRRNVQKLGGKVSVRSDPGKGSTVFMTLPLTLAVLEGMIVRCGNESYVLPIANIIECRANWQSAASVVPGSGSVLEVRGRFVPVVSLGHAFGSKHPASKTTIAIVTDVGNDHVAAFLVDEILGQQQVVVKRMADGTGKIQGIAAATILGDGRVALIVDPDEVARMGVDPLGNNFDAGRRKAA